MEIEIDAEGRRIRVTDIECEVAEDCMKVVIDAWRKVKPRAKPEVTKNRAGFIVESSP